MGKGRGKITFMRGVNNVYSQSLCRRERCCNLDCFKCSIVLVSKFSGESNNGTFLSSRSLMQVALLCGKMCSGVCGGRERRGEETG